MPLFCFNSVCKVFHPKYPNIPITLRHLVTHTSGIKDSFLAYRKGLYMHKKFKLKKRLLPTGYYGGLVSSTADLGLFLMEMMKGYVGEGSMLTAKSYKTMFSVQFEGGDRPGVFWDIGQKTINHNGGDQGVHTLISFSKNLPFGKILFTNTNAQWVTELEDQFQSIWKELYLHQHNFISRK